MGSGNWGAMIQAEKGKEKNFLGFWANLELGVQIEIPNQWTKTTSVSPMGNGGSELMANPKFKANGVAETLGNSGPPTRRSRSFTVLIPHSINKDVF